MSKEKRVRIYNFLTILLTAILTIGTLWIVFNLPSESAEIELPPIHISQE